MTVRLRLTLLYGGLFLAAGLVLLAITYLLVVHAPWPGEPVAPDAPSIDLPGAAPDVETPTAPTAPTIDDTLTQASDDQRADDLRRLLVASSAALGLMAVASTGLGWYVAGRVLRPLATMTDRARRISAENLHERLDAPGPSDELKTLADTIDQLLDRLDSAFQSQRRFVAHASHELRTPLTVQRTLVEVALTDPAADTDTLRTVCQQVLGNVDDQERLVAALLVLARSQRGLDRRTSTDLAAIVQRLLAAGRDRIATRRLRVDARLDPTSLHGDVELLERTIANLLDNAIVHNVDDGWIEVVTGADHHGMAMIRVANSGERLAAGTAAQLLEPFHRDGDGDAPDGLGLGLSIVDAVVRAHGGRLALQPFPDGGLAVDIRLPGDLARNADEPSGRG